MFRLPCPSCGDQRGTFDGYSLSKQTNVKVEPERGIYDAWSAMHKIAEWNGLTWNASPDNTWRWDWSRAS